MAITALDEHISPEPNSGCWLWDGSITGAGYGQISAGGKRVYAHRYSWEQANGRAIPNGMVVMHKCDVRSCVNPDHLSVGTQLDNVRDMHSKGRQVNAQLYGENHALSKLTNEDALEIFNSKEKGVDLANRFNVSPNAISRIRLGHTWVGVTRHD